MGIKNVLHTTLMAGAALLLATTPAAAQQPPQQQPPKPPAPQQQQGGQPQGQMAQRDPMAAKVLQEIHQGDRMEVEMGQLAEQKSTNDDVRHVAKVIAEDHAKVDQRVEKLA